MSKTIKTEVITLNTSKEEVWDVLFNKFGQINLFHPGIDSSHQTNGEAGKVGCERQCDLSAKLSVQEKITAANIGEDFDVEVKGLPMMNKMLANFALSALTPNKTQVQITVEFHTNPGFLALLMAGTMRKKLFTVLIGLKYFLETGKNVNKSKAKEVMNAYKQLGEHGVFSKAA